MGRFRCGNLYNEFILLDNAPTLHKLGVIVKLNITIKKCTQKEKRKPTKNRLNFGNVIFLVSKN